MVPVASSFIAFLADGEVGFLLVLFWCWAALFISRFGAFFPGSPGKIPVSGSYGNLRARD
jgi:hypothetical protein